MSQSQLRHSAPTQFLCFKPKIYHMERIICDSICSLFQNSFSPYFSYYAPSSASSSPPQHIIQILGRWPAPASMNSTFCMVY
jgi:hypothetical protein